MNNNIEPIIKSRPNHTIDVAKFFASIMIVTLHTKPFWGTDFNWYLNSFLCSAVPFFFCISSFLFFKKDNNSITKYIKRIMLLYMVWFIIEIPFIYLRFFRNESFCDGGLAFIKGFFLQNTFYASWYLMASCEAILIVFLLVKYTNHYVQYIVCFIFYLIGLSGSMYGGFIQMIPDIGGGMICVLDAICANQSFIVAVPYMFIGYKLTTNSCHTNTSILSLLVLLTLLFGAIEVYLCKPYCHGSSVSIYMPVFIYLIVSLFLVFKVDISDKLSLYLRNTSILIYLIHPIIMFFLSNINIHEGLKLFVITLILTVSLSLGVVRFSQSFRILKLLY